MLEQITPVVLTRDEEVNIGRTLGQLTWAQEVIVVDSFSGDRTAAIARSFSNVRLLQRQFDSLAGQSVFGVEQAKTPWVLLLDADYFVTEELTGEMAELGPPDDVDGFTARFRYAVRGRILRAALYPPRIVLLRRERTRIWQDGHAHRIEARGATRRLRGFIVHDDRKDFRRFIDRQRKYMREEAEKIRTTPFRDLPASGRIRKLILLAPFAVVFQTLFVRGVVLDGWAGLAYAWERFVAEIILSAELLRAGGSRREDLR